MSDVAGIIDEIVERIAQLDDDTIYELNATIEELMVKRRAAMYEAQHRISVRFSEPCRRGEVPGANLRPWLERAKRWWRQHDAQAERVPRRGIILRLIDWRSGEWREITVSLQTAGRIVKFLRDAAPGRAQIVAVNGALGDLIEVPSRCRQQLIAALAAAMANVER